MFFSGDTTVEIFESLKQRLNLARGEGVEYTLYWKDQFTGILLSKVIMCITFCKPFVGGKNKTG